MLLKFVRSFSYEQREITPACACAEVDIAAKTNEADQLQSAVDELTRQLADLRNKCADLDARHAELDQRL